MLPSPFAAIVMQLVVLHGIDGRLIRVNPVHITTVVAAPPSGKNEHLVSGVNCMLNLSGGKFITVVESCDRVVDLLKAWRNAQ